MNAPPKVSVIVPVYNVEKYLQTCIDSLLAQTLQEIELIFVNDASPDNCLEILRMNEKKHPDKIRVINLEKNVRQGGARNIGIKVARAEYIGFVDSDDFVSPYMYEKMYEKTEAEKVDAVFCKYVEVSDTEKLSFSINVLKSPWSEKLKDLSGKILNDNDLNDLMQYGTGEVAGLWRKDILIKNDVCFPENMRYRR